MEYPPTNRATVEELLEDPWLTNDGKEPMQLYTQDIQNVSAKEGLNEPLTCSSILKMIDNSPTSPTKLNRRKSIIIKKEEKKRGFEDNAD